VIAVDTNILVYAHRKDSVWHGPANAAINSLAEGGQPWAIAWSCLHEFVAVVTHSRIFVPPTPLAKALDQIDAWLESPSLVTLAESRSYWQGFRDAAVAARVKGAVVHDARIAALCSDHGVTELWSADRDFSRFPKLSVRNPLLM